MKSTNKIIGNHFEAELCELLANAGFWCHNLAQNETGQPADVIAVKNGLAVLIDCKVCEHNIFPLSRIEGNQESAMTLWQQRGNLLAYFAIKVRNGQIYMLPFEYLMQWQLAGKGTIKHFATVFLTLQEWLKIFDEA